MPTLQDEVTFQTFDDPVLVKMVNASVEFCGKVKNGQPCWLTFCGPSGTGKTMLAKGTAGYCEKRYDIGWSQVKHWPSFMGKMRSPGMDIQSSIEALGDYKLLVVDEMGMGTDNRDFGVDLLLRLMARRETKWTIFTSNATMEQLAAVDARIASRLIRHNRVVIACDTLDYALRKVRTGQTPPRPPE